MAKSDRPSAADNIGPHLLGRKKTDPDARDFQMRDYLDGTGSGTPLDAALAKLVASHVVPAAVKNWAKLATAAIEGTKPPAPPSPPPNQAVSWESKVVLDQGQTPHCVGFGGAGYLECAPVEDAGVDDALGDAIYYECKVLDGEPQAEDGTSVHSLAKALVARKRIATYVWSTSAQDVADWVMQKGPVVLGTDWMNDMFTPDANGLVAVSGGVAGGHCYFARGYDPATQLFLCQNSWGAAWSLGGMFYLRHTDLDALLQAQGEAMAAAELA